MKLTILETSDIHGYLTAQSDAKRDQTEAYGLSRAATVIQQVRATSEHLLYIDNGDTFLGSALASYAHNELKSPEVIAAAYRSLGIDYWVPGNHDFNFGKGYLEAAIEALGVPVLCANILGANGEPALGQAYAVEEIDGVRIGILGLTTQYIPHWEEPEHITGWTFQSAVDAAEHWVPILKNDEHCDAIVVSYHGGFERDIETGVAPGPVTGENEGYALAMSGLPIDVLLTGHQHREIEGTVNGIPVLQPGTRGTSLGRVELAADADGELTDAHATLIDCRAQAEDATLVAQVAETVQATQDWLDETVGAVTKDLSVNDVYATELSGHAYFDLINQIQMEAMGTDISATSAFTLTMPGFSGSVTRRDVMQNYPFQNKPVAVRLSGAELREILEHNVAIFTQDADGHITIDTTQPLYNFDYYSGIEYRADLKRPIGQRIETITYHGAPVKPDQVLLVANNHYRAGGGGDFPVFDNAHVVAKKDMAMPDVIIDYFRTHASVAVHVKGHWIFE